MSIDPSESGVPQGSQKSGKEDQISNYTGIERKVIEQSKRYINLYTTVEDAFPDMTLTLVFIGRAWDSAMQDMEALGLQLKPPIEKMVSE
jgi:hypothetical protein